MDAAVFADHLQKPIGIGGFQLGQHPVFQHLVHNGVLSLELFQYISIGAPAGFGLFAVGQQQFVKKHGPQLLGGIDVEFMTRMVPDALLQLGNAGVQALAEVIEGLAVHEKAAGFHLRQHGAEGQLRLIVQTIHAQLTQLGVQHRGQLEHSLRPGRFGAGITNGDPLQSIIALGGFQQIGGQGRIKDEAIRGEPFL